MQVHAEKNVKDIAGLAVRVVRDAITAALTSVGIPALVHVRVPLAKLVVSQVVWDVLSSVKADAARTVHLQHPEFRVVELVVLHALHRQPERIRINHLQVVELVVQHVQQAILHIRLQLTVITHALRIVLSLQKVQFRVLDVMLTVVRIVKVRAWEYAKEVVHNHALIIAKVLAELFVKVRVLEHA